VRRLGHLLWRAVLPIAVFLVVALVHYFYLGVFPERNPVQDRWVTAPSGSDDSWLRRYLQSRGYWLGFSYGASLTFAAVAYRRYREQRYCTARNMAIGGVTFSGVLAVVGCYMLGCCGSPMLAVYLNLFGAAFLPLARPLVAALTTLSILGAWWWMNRRKEHPSACGLAIPSHCDDPRCRCD